MNVLWYILVSGGVLAGGMLHSKTKEIRQLKELLRAREKPAVRHFRSYEA